MKVSCLGLGLALMCSGILIPAASAAESLPQKFSLKGDTLVYDTQTDVKDELKEITPDDADQMREILKKHPDIRELQLNSGGGNVQAGADIAGMVLEYHLDTSVDGDCISACVTVFLAGDRRRMTLGSRIGFHQRHWPAQAVHDFYRHERKVQRWSTPFEFGSWIYQGTQGEVYEHLSYMVSRGVEPGFAIETLRTTPESEWYPSRLRLIAAGVLREVLRGR